MSTAKLMEMHREFFIEWDNRYSVGIQSIDQQHRFLIRKIRELQEAMADGRTGEVLGRLIHSLVTYVHFHFAFEERLFAELGYENAAHHRERHADFARQVTELEADLKNNKLRSGALVMAFLRRWLVEHILGEDMLAFGLNAKSTEERDY